MQYDVLPCVKRNWTKILSAGLVACLLLSGALVTIFANKTQSVHAAETPTQPFGSFADVIDLVRPAVVSLRVSARQQSAQNLSRSPGDEFFRDLPKNHPLRKFFPKFFEQWNFGDEPPPEQYATIQGSGFFISADGYLITNYHVVKNSNEVTVIMENEKTYEADVIGVDEHTDLALLKVKDKVVFPFVKLSSDQVRVGDWVIAIGNPFGLGGTVTAGIVSASGRGMFGNSDNDFIQIDAAVNKGNSGGPVFNLKGEVVGVNMAIISPYGGNVGIAFAIPSRTTSEIIAKLRKNGKVIRGFLGVNIQDITDDIATGLKLPSSSGALIARVMPNTPAERASLQIGDVITKVGDKSVKNSRGLSLAIKAIPPGTSVKITFIRAGKKMTTDVALDILKSANTSTQDNSKKDKKVTKKKPVDIKLLLDNLGFSVMQRNVNGKQGIIITKVLPTSKAAKVGIASGQWIASINGQQVDTVEGLLSILKASIASGSSAIVLLIGSDIEFSNSSFIALPLNKK